MELRLTAFRGSTPHAGPFSKERPQSGDVLPDLSDPQRIAQLSRLVLELEVEQLLLRLAQSLLQLAPGLCPQLLGLHYLRSFGCYSSLTVNFVLIGSLWLARDRHSRAICSLTPSISQMMRPGLTTATQ